MRLDQHKLTVSGEKPETTGGGERPDARPARPTPFQVAYEHVEREGIPLVTGAPGTRWRRARIPFCAGNRSTLHVPARQKRQAICRQGYGEGL